ncbi:3'-5' RNA exonuclease complex component [Saitoella coloradoensis]
MFRLASQQRSGALSSHRKSSRCRRHFSLSAIVRNPITIPGRGKYTEAESTGADEEPREPSPIQELIMNHKNDVGDGIRTKLQRNEALTNKIYTVIRQEMRKDYEKDRKNLLLDPYTFRNNLQRRIDEYQRNAVDKPVAAMLEALEKEVNEGLKDGEDDGGTGWGDVSGFALPPPGSLVQSVFDGIKFHGILLEDKFQSVWGTNQPLLITSNGTMRVFKAKDVQFVIPQFVPKELMESVSGPEFLVQKNGFSATVEKILGQLKEFEKGVATREYDVIKKLPEVWEMVRDSDPLQTSSVTTETVVRIVFGRGEGEKLLNEELFATHRAMWNDSVRFWADTTNHRITSRWQARSLERVRGDEIVIDSVRHRDEKFKGFVEKARTLIDFSKRVIRPEQRTRLPETKEMRPIGHYTPNPKDVVTFDDYDRQVIRLMREAIVFSRHAIQLQDLGWLRTTSSRLMRSLERYQNEFDILEPEHIYNFLVDIGVWAPWEQPGLHNVTMQLPGMGYAQPDRDQKVLDETQSFSVEDKMKKWRKDWGELEVYAIDDAGAHELDDGISVEDRADGRWIHLHIANPTAFMDPEHEIAQIARRRGTTLYLPEGTTPILPHAWTRGRLSLGAGVGKEGMPVLTFSARLDEEGRVGDFEVTSGLVRNVKTFTYNDVEDIFLKRGWAEQSIAGDAIGYMKHEFGWNHELEEGVTERRLSPITERDVNNLKAIWDVMRDFKKERLRNGMVLVDNYNLSIKLQQKLPKTPQLQHLEAPVFYDKLPGIRYELSPQSRSASRALVADVAVLGNKIAAMFARRNNIPLIYRTQSFNHAHSTTPWETILASRTSDGYVANEHSGAVLESGREGFGFGTTPGPFELLGLTGVDDGYSRATSPLRRYLDMIGHWNFEAHIRGEEPIFSNKDLEKIGLEGGIREQQISGISTSIDRSWTMRVLKRILERDGSLDMRSMVIGNQRSMRSAKAMNVKYGVQCVLQLDGVTLFEDLQAVRPGVVFEGKQLAKLHPATRHFAVKANLTDLIKEKFVK